MADSGQLFPVCSLTHTKPEGCDRYYHQETRPQDLQVASSPRVTQPVIGKGMLGCWALALPFCYLGTRTQQQGSRGVQPEHPGILLLVIPQAFFFQMWLLYQVSQLGSWNLETRPDDGRIEKLVPSTSIQKKAVAWLRHVPLSP